MSTLITGERLKQLVREDIIQHGLESCVGGIKYDFRLSDRFLKTKHQTPCNISDFNPAEKENYSVEPGETVFVLSEETLRLPKDIKAEVSHKRKLSQEGIRVSGGFCIDPGYEGRLIFGILNFGSRTFILERGSKLIAAQFYRLSHEEIGTFPTPTPLHDFPDELIQIVRGMRTISVGQTKLETLVQDHEKKLNDITKSVDSHKITLTFAKFILGGVVVAVLAKYVIDLL